MNIACWKKYVGYNWLFKNFLKELLFNSYSLHIDIILLHVEIFLLHVDIFVFSFEGTQRLSVIKDFCFRGVDKRYILNLISFLMSNVRQQWKNTECSSMGFKPVPCRMHPTGPANVKKNLRAEYMYRFIARVHL